MIDAQPPKLFLFAGWASDFRVILPLIGEIGWRGLAAPVETTLMLAGASPENHMKSAAIEEFILGFKNRKTILAGWSLGAQIAMRIALARPELIEALILISPTARMTGDGEYPGADPRALRAMRRKLALDPKSMIEDFFREAFAPTIVPDLVSELAGRAAVPPMRRLAEGLACLATEDLRAEASRIENPCLIVHGMEDRIIPAASGEWLASRIPDCRLALLPGEGHMLPLTATQATAAAIKGFLDERIG